MASGFFTSLVPIGLAEAAVLGLGAMRPPAFALTLIGAFTFAHVLGKVAWYWLGTNADRVTDRHPRTRGYIVKARVLVGNHPVYGAGVLASAAVASLPPFHLAAIAAGIAKVPLWRFVLISLVGRSVRFGLIASVPGLVRSLLE